MAVQEVNKRLLDELQEIGFPLARATRALHYSVQTVELAKVKKSNSSKAQARNGNSSIDAALDWLSNHDNDPDIDQIPLCTLVPVNINIEDADPSSISEQVKLKVQELRDRAHKKKEEEEKRGGRKRDKLQERRRAREDLLEAKRIQEENERQRLIAFLKVEKEQMNRERDKIRRKLQQDKAERRRSLGLPVDDLPIVKNASSLMQEKKDSFPVKSATLPVMSKTKTELMQDCLRSLRRNHMDNDAKVRKAFLTLLIYVRNVLNNPDEEKFRKIRFSNPAFQERVGNMKEGVEFLELCGFQRVEGDKFLFLPGDKVDLAVLESAVTVLNSAITNPFFGLLSKVKGR